MLKTWASVVSLLVFVFVTLTAPMPVQAFDKAPAPHTVRSMVEMPRMAKVDACHHAHQQQPVQPVRQKGCCTDGCQCPLGHCPASLGLLGLTAQPMALSAGAVHLARPTQGQLPAHWGDALKRPPRL